MKLLDQIMHSDPAGIKNELRDLGRAITWGLIFGMPVLYTMEVWLRGREVSSLTLTVLLGGVLLLNIFIAYLSGMREDHKLRNLGMAVEDGVTSTGIAIILSAIILFAIGQFDSSTGWNTIMSKIVLEACIMSVGINFTNMKFEHVTAKKFDLNESRIHHQLAVAGGALVFSFNVAPTEEVILIASKLSFPHLFFLFVLELVICSIVLHSSGLWQDELTLKTALEVLRTWVISFVVAAIMLASLGFGSIGFAHTLFIPAVLVLALPAVVGGSAGRLAV